MRARAPLAMWAGWLCAFSLAALCAKCPTAFLKHTVKNRRLMQKKSEEKRLRMEQKMQRVSLQEAPDIIETLRLMSLGKSPGSPTAMLESYIEHQGRSLHLACELAVRATARSGGNEQIEEVLSRASSAGLERAMLLDFLIDELSKQGQLKMAKEYFTELAPSEKRLERLFRAAIKRKDVAQALQYLREMEEEGFVAKASQFNQLLQISVRREGPAQAETRLKSMVEEGLQPTERAFGTLLDAYALKGDVPACQRLLRSMVDHALVPEDMHYGQVLKACAKKGDPHSCHAAEQIARAMRKQRLKLNEANKADLMTVLGARRYSQLCRSLGMHAKPPRSRSRRVGSSKASSF